MKSTMTLDGSGNPDMQAAFGDIGPGVRVRISSVEGMMVSADGESYSLEVDSIDGVERIESEPEPEQTRVGRVLAQSSDMDDI